MCPSCKNTRGRAEGGGGRRRETKARSSACLSVARGAHTIHSVFFPSSFSLDLSVDPSGRSFALLSHSYRKGPVCVCVCLCVLDLNSFTCFVLIFAFLLKSCCWIFANAYLLSVDFQLPFRICFYS